MSHLYYVQEFGQGHQAEWKRRVFRFFAEGIYGVGFSYDMGQSIPKVGSAVPECSLTTRLGLHIVGPGNSKERPGCRAEGTRRAVRQGKVG